MHLLKLGSTLIVLMLAYQPSNVEAQCSIVSTQQTTMSFFRHVKKYLGAGPYLCARTQSMSAMCLPDVTGNVTYFHAYARATAMTPSCMWRCIFCGTINASNTITSNGSDGLPVELIEFSIEQEPLQ